MKRIRLNKIISLIISFVMVLALFPSYSLGAAYNLTINYKYENGDKAAEAYTASVDVDVPYSVSSPDIAGYRPDKATVSGTMPAEDVVVNVTYHPLYTATIHYQYEDGTEAYPSYIDQLLAGDTYNVSSPSITGYKPDRATVSGTMPAENVETIVTYHTAYTLTIHYQNADGTEASAPYTSELVAGETYSITSPTITGYRPEQATVSGTMAAGNADVTVVYHKTYTVR